MSATPLEVPRKITPPLLLEKKTSRRKIVCLTANDYPLARILDEAEVDVVLVGDSLGMTRLGYDSTLPVTIPEMLVHLKAARRAVDSSLARCRHAFRIVSSGCEISSGKRLGSG